MLKYSITAFITSLILVSCNEQKSVQNTIETKTAESPRKQDRNLINFENEYLSEVAIYDTTENNELYIPENVIVNEINDIIYVSFQMNTNACDNLEATINFQKNNLILQLSNLSKESCLSASKFGFRYIILNKEKKKLQTGYKSESLGLSNYSLSQHCAS